MDITLTNTLDHKSWRAFVDAHPQGNIFHTPEMYEVFSIARGYQPEVHAAVGTDGKVLALLTPVHVSLREGLLRRLTTRSILYGGILAAEDRAGKEALQVLLSDFLKKSARQSLFTEFRHLSDAQTYQPIFAQYQLEYQAHLNYLIHIGCLPEEVFRNFGSHMRRHIRQQMKRGEIVIEEIEERGKISIFYDLIKKSYSAAKVPVADISLFEAAFDVLHPRGMVKFWLARVGGEYIASSAELVYKDVVYGWYGGVDRAYSNYNPNEVLTWHILKWGSENGYQTYDFGGAGTPGEAYGVRDFKVKFGGELVSYGRNVFVPSPALLRMSETGYTLLRRFMVG